MVLKSYYAQTGFWSVTLAAFTGTVAGTLTVRLADYLLGLWLN